MKSQKQRMESLVSEAKAHKATNHPYLIDLQNGNFEDPLWAIKDFSVQYAGYTAWFPKYLTITMSKLEKHSHRMHFIQNLSEEGGIIDPDEAEELKSLGIEEDWVQGIPHPELFKRFQQALGVHPDQEVDEPVIIWREMFYSILLHGSAAEAIGAIGIGTESIVKYMYQYLTKGIQDHTALHKRDYVFFELHSEIDDAHGKAMIEVANELTENSPESYFDLRKGMLKALGLRGMFWDLMHERAKNLYKWKK